MSFESVMPPYNASDPHARFLSASSLDFLLIELVPLAYRVTNEVDAATLEASDAAAAAAATAGNTNSRVSVTSGKTAVLAGAGAGAGNGNGRKMDEDDERDAVFYRLETLGYRVGQGLVER